MGDLLDPKKCMSHRDAFIDLEHGISDSEAPLRNLIFTGRNEAVLNTIFVLTDFFYFLAFKQEARIGLSFDLVKGSGLAPQIKLKVCSGHLLLFLLKEDIPLSLDILGLVIAPDFIRFQQHVLVSNFYLSSRAEIVLADSVLFVSFD